MALPNKSNSPGIRLKNDSMVKQPLIESAFILELGKNGNGFHLYKHVLGAEKLEKSKPTLEDVARLAGFSPGHGFQMFECA